MFVKINRLVIYNWKNSRNLPIRVTVRISPVLLGVFWLSAASDREKSGRGRRELSRERKSALGFPIIPKILKVTIRRFLSFYLILFLIVFCPVKLMIFVDLVLI